MAANQGFIFNGGEPYVYQENNSGFSGALGIDVTGVYSVSVSGIAGTRPNPTSQLVIDPLGNTTVRSSTKVVADGIFNITSLLAAGALINSATGDVTTTTGTAGFVLTSNGAAAPSFQALPSGGVTSITGTANQIAASAATGAVTLSIPSTFIAPGSIASTTTLTAGNGFTVTTGTTTITPLSTSGIVINNASGIITTTATTNHAVQVGNASGQLTSLTVGTTGQVLIGATGADPAFGAASGIAVTSVNGTANQITSSNSGVGSTTLSIPATFIAPGSIASTTSITAGNLTTAGIVYNSVTTGLLTSHATTQYNVQIGNATGQLADVAPGATGIPLISQGVAANPVFGTATVPGGGTGLTSTTAYAVLTGGTTSTGALQQVSGVGSLNQVLVSQGAGTLPIWAPVPATAGVTSLTGTANQVSVSASTGAVTISTPSTFIAPGTIASTTTLAAGNLTTAGVVQNSVTTGILTSYAATNHGVQIGNSSGQLASIAVGTTGQVLIGATGADPAFGAASGVSVVSVSGTANQITSSNSGVGSTTLSIPSTFIAPGSIASTTTNAAGTNFLLSTTSSTVGNILYAGNRIFHAFGTNNLFAGVNAGNYTLTQTENAAFGPSAPLNALTSGSGNTAIGSKALQILTTGSNNTALGFQAGLSYSSSESNNFVVNSTGTAAESNVIRLGSGTGSGSQQFNKAFISGIYNITVGATAGACIVDSTNQVGTISGASGTVMVGGTKPAFTALNTLAVTSIAGTANQITASASVGAVTLSTPSTFIAPGSISATTVHTTTTATTSTAGQYQINGSAVLHTFGTGLGNVFVGKSSGNFTLTDSEHNTCVGELSGSSLTTATGHNTYIGYQAGKVDDGAGGSNTAVGHNAFLAFTGATLARNTAVGADALLSVVTGRRNVAVGYSAGSALTTSDSDNILIGPNVTGTAGNNNRTQIGLSTGTGTSQINSCFIAGIQGITVTGTAVLVSTADQLGIAVSSRRYKDNIKDMDDYSSRLMKLRPVTFNYKVGEDHSLQSGLIAEEVFDVMPSLVVMDKAGLPQTVKYHDLPALLLNEIQKLHKRIAALEARG